MLATAASAAAKSTALPLENLALRRQVGVGRDFDIPGAALSARAAPIATGSGS